VGRLLSRRNALNHSPLAVIEARSERSNAFVIGDVVGPKAMMAVLQIVLQ
jgi:hypothetical protein